MDMEMMEEIACSDKDFKIYTHDRSYYWSDYDELSLDMKDLYKALKQARIPVGEIMSICLYGSILRKYDRYEKPRDIDVGVILLYPIESEKVFTVPLRQKGVNYIRHWHTGYGSKTEYRSGVFHVVFRSVRQFTGGVLSKKDGISLSICREGLPIVGIRAFDHIVNDLMEERSRRKVRWVNGYMGVYAKI